MGLIGSQTQGEVGPGKDHDLLAVIENLSPSPLARQRSMRGTLLPILDPCPDPSVLLPSPQEVAPNLRPLTLDACVDGICLYGAAHFEPYRQRQRRRSGYLNRAGSRWMAR